MRCYVFGQLSVLLISKAYKAVYRFFLQCLLLLPPEFSHQLTLKLIRWIYPAHRVKRLTKKFPQHPIEIAGLHLSNPVGLAAGLDKDGQCLDAWFAFGFGFIEVGTVTPKAQAGNPKPRLFRLKKFKALINRMGFNNAGVDALVEHLKKRSVPGIVGVNIGKNRDTPLEKAVEDYCICLQKIYPFSDYVTVNISSPNTPGLRDLQEKDYLDNLLHRLMALRNKLEQQHQRRLPLFVKIDADLEEKALISMLDIFLKHKVDGIIAINTSLSRETVKTHQYAREAGGLSGDPIYTYTKKIVKTCINYLDGQIPVIAVGGINSPERVQEMLNLGASAVQIYSSFIFEGPLLINKIINKL